MSRYHDKLAKINDRYSPITWFNIMFSVLILEQINQFVNDIEDALSKIIINSLEIIDTTSAFFTFTIRTTSCDYRIMSPAVLILILILVNIVVLIIEKTSKKGVKAE